MVILSRSRGFSKYLADWNTEEKEENRTMPHFLIIILYISLTYVTIFCHYPYRR